MPERGEGDHHALHAEVAADLAKSRVVAQPGSAVTGHSVEWPGRLADAGQGVRSFGLDVDEAHQHHSVLRMSRDLLRDQLCDDAGADDQAALGFMPAAYPRTRGAA